MKIVSTLASQCAVMFILMAVGFSLYRLRLISDRTTKDLGAALLNVVFPLVIVRSFWGKFSPENLSALSFTVLLSAAALILAMTIARACFPRDGVAEFSAAFSNAGFIGIPLVQAALDEDAVFYIAFFISALNVLQWTYGKQRIAQQQGTPSVRSALTSPILIGLVIGVVLFFIDLPCPAVVASSLSSIANLNSPLAMIILGAHLAKSSFRNMFCTLDNYVVSLVRLALIPAVTLALLYLMPGSPLIKTAVFIAAAAPTGSNVAVFCQQLDKDTQRASAIVCLSTLLSLTTVPITVGIASLVF